MIFIFFVLNNLTKENFVPIFDSANKITGSEDIMIINQ